MKRIHRIFILVAIVSAMIMISCPPYILTPTDWGDAPDKPYLTWTANNGASHTIVDKFHLGNLIDAEWNGQPNATATGDDIAGLADEDGVTFSVLIPGQTAYVTVVSSLVGKLDAWVDFDHDGVWSTVGDQIFASVPLVAGSNLLSFVVPGTAVSGGFARFRLSTAGGLSFSGPAKDGEVEDYAVNIMSAATRIDWGDAPDGIYPTLTASYPTLASSNGASHLMSTKLYLGAQIDSEPNGQPNIAANGDDIVTLPDDEDGVTFTSALIRNQPAAVTVVTVGAGKLDAWMDFNHNGSWADAGDQIFTSMPLTAGSHALTFPVPGSASVGGTYVRFRLSSAGGLSCNGFSIDGEVEDYRVGIE